MSSVGEYGQESEKNSDMGIDIVNEKVIEKVVDAEMGQYSQYAYGHSPIPAG